MHSGLPGLPTDGEDVPGEVDHAVADGDGGRVGHVTGTTCTEARLRTEATPTTSTAARSGAKTGRKLRWSDGATAGKGGDRPDG